MGPRRRSPPREIGHAPSERTRKWVHIAFGAGALTLRYLSWWQAALVAAAAVAFNVGLLRTVFGGRIHRPHEAASNPGGGIVLYPLSVLLLILVFPSRLDIVAAAWGILAAGDGSASLIGVRFGRRKWPWNRRKSVAGSIAFVVLGGAAGALLAWWTRPAIVPPPDLLFALGAPFLAALVAAAVETVPIRLDDNLSTAAAAAATLWALSLVSLDLAQAFAAVAPGAIAVALPVNLAAAAIGYRIGGITASGAIVGGLIGTIIHACAGWPGWLLLIATFGCATLSSRAGLERKTLLGIAEERGGRRGAGNAIANTGLAAVAAMLSVLSHDQLAWLIAFTAALTTAASDTVASEIGKAWGLSTWSLVPLRRVRPGTSGAVSVEGSAAGLAAAAAMALLAHVLGLIPAGAIAAVVVGAIAGSLVESLLGATFEGAGLLNNDALNLINTAVGAVAAVIVSGAPA